MDTGEVVVIEHPKLVETSVKSRKIHQESLEVSETKGSIGKVPAKTAKKDYKTLVVLLQSIAIIGLLGLITYQNHNDGIVNVWQFSSLYK
ncbi:MAG: hypothetical protein ACYCUI_14550 [Vulcanimicrobiaceae bacterium]